MGLEVKSICCQNQSYNSNGIDYSGNVDGGGGSSSSENPKEKKQTGAVTGNKAANVVINACGSGGDYKLYYWRCYGFDSNDTVKFNATIINSKTNNSVGHLTVKIGTKKQYIPIVEPSSSNKDSSEYKTFNDIIQKAPDKAVDYKKLDNIFNEKPNALPIPSNSSSTESMFDTLYNYFNNKKMYTKINRENEYDKICARGGRYINDDGVKGFLENKIKKGLVYFTDINKDCNCVGKDVYFGNTDSAIVIIYPSGKIVRFSVGKNRGFGAGWDDIHMITKL